MAKVYKDGWHTVAGYEVQVKDGRIVRGIVYEGRSARDIFPYIPSHQYNCWVQASLTPGAFRARLRRGTVIMR